MATDHSDRRDFLTDLPHDWSKQAEEGGIPEEVLHYWRKFLDRQAADNPVLDPELYWCEADSLAAVCSSTWGAVRERARGSLTGLCS